MGQGDMLFLPPGSHKLIRSQGTLLEDEELHKIIDFLTEQASPEFHPQLMKIKPKGLTEGGDRDPLFDEAVKIVLETRRGSVSLLQRRLTVGYSRASRLIDQMADAGIVGEFKGSQAREVIMDMEDWNALRAAVSQEVANAGFAADDENFSAEPIDEESDSIVDSRDHEASSENETDDSSDTAEDSQQSPPWMDASDSAANAEDEEESDDDEEEYEDDEEDDSEEVDDEYEEEEEYEDGDEEVHDEEYEDDEDEDGEEYEEEDDDEDEDVEYEYEYVEVDDDEAEEEDNEDEDEEEAA